MYFDRKFTKAALKCMVLFGLALKAYFEHPTLQGADHPDTSYPGCRSTMFRSALGWVPFGPSARARPIGCSYCSSLHKSYTAHVIYRARGNAFGRARPVVFLSVQISKIRIHFFYRRGPCFRNTD